MRKIWSYFLSLVFLFALGACENEQEFGSVLDAASAAGGGNLECVGDFDFTTGRMDWEDGQFWVKVDGLKELAVMPEGLTVEVVDDKYVNWSYEDPNGVWCMAEMTVIVKGGPDAMVYETVGEQSGEGLQPPVKGVNPQGVEIVYDLSNLTLCFNLERCFIVGVPFCFSYEEETAFGGNTKGPGKGAWWFAYDTQVGGAQAIYPGQKSVEGASVEIVNNEIVITLGEGMILQDVDEPVKIQGYNTLPTSRPAAGLFTTYKGTNLTVKGNGSRFYVIHLDVLLVSVVECEPETGGPDPVE